MSTKQGTHREGKNDEKIKYNNNNNNFDIM